MAPSHPMPLRVASAFPDPPFEVPGGTPSGFDHDLIGAIAADGRLAALGSTWFADSDPAATAVVT